MAIPKLKKQDVIDALKFIDENEVPEHNTSVKYVLVSESGKKYPPKYVVAVADHLVNGADISTESFNSVDAKNYLESLGFSIETKQQEKFELSITAESVQSTDERFGNHSQIGEVLQRPLYGSVFRRANNLGCLGEGVVHRKRVVGKINGIARANIFLHFIFLLLRGQRNCAVSVFFLMLFFNSISFFFLEVLPCGRIKLIEPRENIAIRVLFNLGDF